MLREWVGVFEYALVDDTGRHDLAELRSFQDWNLRYALESVKGVSEVASVGGFVKQYQIDLDPDKLAAYHLPLSAVVEVVKRSNADVGGKIFEVASTEYFVRGEATSRAWPTSRTSPSRWTTARPFT